MAIHIGNFEYPACSSLDNCSLIVSFISTEPDWGPNYNNIIVAALKARRKSDGQKIKSTITVGSTVGVSGKFEYWLGTVEKVMKTRCAVKNMNNGMRYAVPLNLSLIHICRCRRRLRCRSRWSPYH